MTTEISNVVLTVGVSASSVCCASLHFRIRNLSDMYAMSRFLLAVLIKKSSLSYLQSVFKHKLT